MRLAHVLPPPYRTSANAAGVRALGSDEMPIFMGVKHYLRTFCERLWRKGSYASSGGDHGNQTLSNKESV